MKDYTYKGLVIVLLSAILIVQIISLTRTSKLPTYGELYGQGARTKTPEQRRALLAKVPLVRINGDVEVRGEVNTRIDELQFPLEVTIQR